MFFIDLFGMFGVVFVFRGLSGWIGWNFFSGLEEGCFVYLIGIVWLVFWSYLER